jgi:hypothetical protein
MPSQARNYLYNSLFVYYRLLSIPCNRDLSRVDENNLLPPVTIENPLHAGDLDAAHALLFLQVGARHHDAAQPSQDACACQDSEGSSREERTLSPLLFSSVNLPDLQHDVQMAEPCPENSCIDVADVPIPRSRKPRESKISTVVAALDMLQGARVTPTELLSMIISGEYAELYSYRTSFLSSTNNTHLCDLLSTIHSDDKGRKILNTWMDTFGVEYVCKLVSVEMETAKPQLHMNLDEVTSEYMSKWNINNIMDPISTKITPVWSKVLYAATEPLKKDDDKPNMRNRGIVSTFNLLFIDLGPRIVEYHK